jgi:pseudaminic acid biosynthesis-associated methylase
MKTTTEQESFWAGEFGDNYISRNIGKELLAANVSFFARCLSKATNCNSIVEFGANVGMNLSALRILYPSIKLKAVEINKVACEELQSIHNDAAVFNSSINDYASSKDEPSDIALIKTVLIHINPSELQKTYEALYTSSKKYILICEYYNTKPVTVEYRGHSEKLFKRDFAGEMLDLYSDLKLVDYGFVYHREQSPVFNLIDDISWFLLEKN